MTTNPGIPPVRRIVIELIDDPDLDTIVVPGGAYEPPVTRIEHLVDAVRYLVAATDRVALFDVLMSRE
jgi:putative intracellular protease/amidase